MLITGKELTVKELKHIIQELEDDLDLYLTLKKINYNKTQPGASKIKNVVTSKTNTISDRFAQYVIKDEEYDEKIYSTHQSLLAYEQRLLNKLNNMKSSDSKTYITYLKEEEGLTFEEITKIVHYSLRQVKRIYYGKN